MTTIDDHRSRRPQSTATTLGQDYAAVPTGPVEISSLMRELSVPRWWPVVERELRDLLADRPVQTVAFKAAYDWTRSLSPQMPRPYLGIGDDGSVSVEWDRGGNLLHIRFDGTTAEVYFAGQNGDEFETLIDAGTEKVRSALITIARS